jgi:ribosome biogenesis protein Nip4
MVLSFLVNSFYFEKFFTSGNKILDIVITKNLLKPTGSFKFSYHTHIKAQMYITLKK